MNANAPMIAAPASARARLPAEAEALVVRGFEPASARARFRLGLFHLKHPCNAFPARIGTALKALVTHHDQVKP